MKKKKELTDTQKQILISKGNQKKKHTGIKIIGLIVFLLVLANLVSFVTKDNNKAEQATTMPKITIERVSLYQLDNINLETYCQVINNTNQEIGGEFWVVVRDSTGNTLRTWRTYKNAPKPGQRETFKSMIPISYLKGKKDIRVIWELGKISKGVDYTVQ